MVGPYLTGREREGKGGENFFTRAEASEKILLEVEQYLYALEQLKAEKTPWEQAVSEIRSLSALLSEQQDQNQRLIIEVRRLTGQNAMSAASVEQLKREVEQLRGGENTVASKSCH